MWHRCSGCIKGGSGARGDRQRERRVWHRCSGCINYREERCQGDKQRERGWQGAHSNTSRNLVASTPHGLVLERRRPLLRRVPSGAALTRVGISSRRPARCAPSGWSGAACQDCSSVSRTPGLHKEPATEKWLKFSTLFPPPQPRRRGSQGRKGPSVEKSGAWESTSSSTSSSRNSADIQTLKVRASPETLPWPSDF